MIGKSLWFTRENLKRLANAHNTLAKDTSTAFTAVNETFTEVYTNLDDTDDRVTELEKFPSVAVQFVIPSDTTQWVDIVNYQYLIKKNGQLLNSNNEVVIFTDDENVSYTVVYDEWDNKFYKATNRGVVIRVDAEDGATKPIVLSGFELFKCCDISVQDLVAGDRVDVTVDPASIDDSVSCGICPVTESLNGVLRLFAHDIPSNDIPAQYWIIKAKAGVTTSAYGFINVPGKIDLASIGAVSQSDFEKFRQAIESSSGGGGEFALPAVTDIKTLTAHGRVYIKWTDPDDLVLDSGETLAVWGGTLLVRKAGSMPASSKDGTIVLDSKTRNVYQSDYFCDSGLTDGVTYYYKLFPYTTNGAYTNSADDEFTATPEAVSTGDVSNIGVTSAGNGKLAVKWTDPESTVTSDGVTLATWASTKVVYKTGGYPTSPEDGILAINSTTQNAYTSNAYIISGLDNGTEYYVSFFPISTEGAVNSNTVTRTTCTPNRFTISAEPSQSGSLTYTGSAQSPTWDNYDSAQLTLSGTTSGTDAGSYSAVFTPTEDYQWPDGSTEAKIIEWTIGKAAGSLSLNKTSLSISGAAGTTETITVTRTGDGAISATSSNTSVATVSVSGTTIAVTAKSAGSATITVSVAADTNHTAPANQTCSLVSTVYHIYGVSWDGTSTTKWSRTDAAAGFTDPVPYVAGATNYGSPFDNLMPWKGMVKSERAGGTMVAIPKFWFKLTQNGKGMKIQIANQAVSGFSVSPAHMNRGDGKGERDVVYVGRYHCGASNYKSVTGQKPKVSITRATARTEIHKLGSNIWQWDWAIHFTIQLLYLVEFAGWNSQSCIGGGCGNNSSMQAMGYTDSMPYHTGTTQSSRSTLGLGTQYRNIEGLWDNAMDWCDGCYYDSNGLNIILNPSKFSDSSGGISVGMPIGGWPSAFTVTNNGGYPMFIPSAGNSMSSATGGSDSTYSCDFWYYDGFKPCIYVGGYYKHFWNWGLFYVFCGDDSETSAYMGSRSMELS